MNKFDAQYQAWKSRAGALDEYGKLFVVGCAKSGTTWLEKLLDGHPELHVRGEGRYFWSLAQNLQQAFRAFNESLPSQGASYAPWWSDEEFAFVLRTTIDAALARSLASGPAKPGLRIVGDKTPMHTLAIGPLHQLYPEAKFIHIIRDPRDATISQWLFWAKKNDPRPFEEFVEYSITHVWPLNVQSARKQGSQLGALYTEVRYEDLLVAEGDELRRLAGFLGVDDGDDAIDACIANGSFKKHSGGRKRGDDGGEAALFRKGVAGDWVNHIPVELANRCCDRISDLMRSCGYEPHADSTRDTQASPDDKHPEHAVI